MTGRFFEKHHANKGGARRAAYIIISRCADAADFDINGRHPVVSFCVSGRGWRYQN
jgi:hypothetical protein